MLKRKIKKWLIFTILPPLLGFLLLLLIVASAAAAIGGLGDSDNQVYGSVSIPPEVEAYRTTMFDAATLYGIPDYVDVLLAIMAHQSAGLGGDPMFSSNTEYNTKYWFGITDPIYSIDCGVHYFADLIEMTGTASPYDARNLYVAIQAYNFGKSYVDFAQNAGGYNLTNATDYLHLHQQSSSYRWWWNPNYVMLVLRYYTIGTGTPTGTFLWPVPGWNNMSRGWIEGVHKALDITGPVGATIIASDGGSVTVAEWHDVKEHSYGYYIIIDHGNGLQSLYAHNSELLVAAGQTVSAGEPIAYLGSTGNSTGPHLHFEIMVDGVKVDPIQYVSPETTTG